MTDLLPFRKDAVEILNHTSRPRPVQLIDSKDFLSSPRPSLVQLNRLPTDFSDKDSAEVIPDYNFLLVLSPTVHEISILGFSLRL